ncbi:MULTISPECIES: ABC transporter ATP-binding protein [Roseobacteraceae]|uniref:Putative siderophore transport system ATP-binding protein YusV n=1 Tax=Pseudosulfitobacter pseudonitzschiae TaxID=1402135 RepID=A0A221JW86_9RHOB|nr:MULTISPECIES: ABC transporter ATP-binding protein [Roseobacteraceae]ASM71004.1 putative siderophore transport system ATP-binding protein YusV [Pseudosulfitobacter pseudonitzschiae]
MTGFLFDIQNLSLRIGRSQIYDHFSVTFPKGGLTGIVGPNGCGKSTLLRCLARVQQPDEGQIAFEGQPLAELAATERARRIAYLPQNPPILPDMTIAGLVAKGRTPWRKAFRPLSGADHDAINRALRATGLFEIRSRRLTALSGGQRQRVWLALALAQDTPVILLDEPTAFLDLQHQLSLLRLLRQLADEQQRSIVMVLHELTLAGRFCDHLLGLRDGQLICAGPAEQAITPQTVAALYDLQVDVARDPVFGKPVVYPRE